jgi:hypothetical protein
MTISFATQSSFRMMNSPATIDAARRMSALRQLAPDGRLCDAGVDVLADLAQIDAEAPESSARHFYRGPNGAVIRKDDPYAPEEIQRLSLTVLTKAQADAA